MDLTVTLAGASVHLLPLSPDHVDDLVTAATEDRSTYAYAPVPDGRDAMTDLVASALAARDRGEQVPFATWSAAEGRIVGSTRFLRLQRWDWSQTARAGQPTEGDPPLGQRGELPDRCDIGATWLAGSAQRTSVNTEAKLLMLAHAFEVWKVHAVGIQTDVRNDRSRRAIERLGLRLDGVLRVEQPAVDGSLRDTARYSMTATEWPPARERLRARLASGPGGASRSEV
ncbi:MAG: GNAT family protein [Actinomycetota bacterium]|jgi:RimJ/RimL family protein N-acetyltransferase|nr:GNAT family protein [Actinomycetota bacterium]